MAEITDTKPCACTRIDRYDCIAARYPQFDNDDLGIECACPCHDKWDEPGDFDDQF